MGLPHKQEAVEVFVDLWVEPHVYTETLPTVIGELVRMLPTVIGELVRMLPTVIGELVRMLPTVIGELVRMLPTVGLVRRADYPQCEGSVLPCDSRLGSACTMEASLSH